MQRSLAENQRDLTESEASRQISIEAPRAGRVTALLANTGQIADPQRPLLSIVPSGARLHAELYAPSRAVGFVKIGDSVRLRYQAYPYQTFGQQQGRVLSVARTALPGSEVTALGDVIDQGNSKEPLYRITVELEQQQMQANGQPHELQAGMLLEADILQESLYLYEWLLEPLRGLTRKL